MPGRSSDYGVTQFDGVPLVNPFREDAGDGPLLMVFPNKVIGKLSLHNAGNESLFYQGDLIENRNSLLHEQIVAALWQPGEWVYARKREEINMNVGGNTDFIEGLFQDSWGVNEYESLSYKLHLYFWIEKCNA
jgi:hypothetical protein